MGQRKSKIGKLLFGIIDIVIVFIFLFPFLWMLSVSLQTEKEITTIPLTLLPKIPQWKNYVEAFASAPFLYICEILFWSFLVWWSYSCS